MNNNDAELLNLKEENILLKGNLTETQKEILNLKSNMFILKEKNESILQENIK
jgi:hypothetical protein